MKSSNIVLLIGLVLICGCVDFGPFISKSNLGNLEVNVVAPEGLDAQAARIYVDDVFIGNVSARMPILHVKNGKHVVKVELEGAATYTQAVTILGDPNHQVLNVALKRNNGT
jgi:PEGA domain-containing protein